MLVLLRYAFRFFLLTCATLIVVIALLTGLLRLGLPYASSYKSEIQAWVSDYLGTPVEIGSMTVAWAGLSPRLSLDNVALNREGSQQFGVRLDQIQLDLNVIKSLYSGDVHTNEVTISGADLSVEYFGHQEFRVRGYGFSADRVSDSENTSLDVVSWLMNASRVGLLNSRIKLIDRARGIDYELTELNIRAENTRTFHQLRVDLQLPGQLGKSLEIGLDLMGTRNALALSTGKFYVNGSALRLQDWMPVWPKRTVEVFGNSDLEIWGSWGGNQLQALRGKLNGSDLAVSAVHDVSEQVVLDDVLADLTWQRSADGWITEIDQLDLTQGDYVNSFDNAVIEKVELDDGVNLRVSGQGDSLRVETVAGLLATMTKTPRVSDIALTAAGTSPSGELRDWKFDTEYRYSTRPDNPSDSVPRLSLTADFNQLATKPYKAIPGIDNLSGVISMSDNVGSISIDNSALRLTDPKVFPDTLELAQVNGTFTIDLNNQHKLIHTDALSVADNGLIATSQFTLGRPSGNLHVELQTDFTLDDISTVPNYLPTGVLRPRLKSWLNSAFITGAVQTGKLTFAGNPADFPFDHNEGTFSVAMDVAEAAVRFRPDWPVVTELSGELNFNGASMSFETTDSNIGGTAVSRAHVGIEDMRRAMLKVTGANSGPLSAFVEFANAGPLRNILSPALDGVDGTGNVNMDIAVMVPLRAKAKRSPDEVLSVDGTLFLKQNDLVSDKFKLVFGKAIGAVEFTEKGVTVNGLKANYLGAAVQIDASTRTVKGLRQTDLTVDGMLEIGRVMRQHKVPVAAYFHGPSRWRLKLQIPYAKAGSRHPGVSLSATSDLVGTELLLPAPLKKNSDVIRTVTVSTSFKDSATQSWLITDDMMKTQVRVNRESGIQSLMIAMGESRLPKGFAKGIRIDGQTPTLSFDGWIRTISEIISSGPKSTTPTSIMPVFANLDVQNMLVGTTELGAVKYRINTDEQFINGVIGNKHLRGNIRIPREHWKNENAIRTRIVYADSKLIDALKTPVDGPQSPPVDPRVFPRLEIHIAELALKAIKLKGLGIRTEPDAAGMKITALGFADDTAQMMGSGIWHMKDPQALNAQLANDQISRFDITLQSANVGSTLARFGIDNAIAEGSGSAQATLGWNGPAYKAHVATLNGVSQINLKNGRLLKIEPGAAKLVGLFALQELPRRLSLDFRDVVKDGLDFQTIAGTVKVANGVATTDLLRLEGPVGVIDVSGVSDLNQKTFDQNIQVLPRISAALPIIGLISGGATAGIGAFLATPILKALGLDFDRIGLTMYKLAGNWSDPKITRLQNPTRLEEQD